MLEARPLAVSKTFGWKTPPPASRRNDVLFNVRRQRTGREDCCSKFYEIPDKLAAVAVVAGVAFGPAASAGPAAPGAPAEGAEAFPEVATRCQQPPSQSAASRRHPTCRGVGHCRSLLIAWRRRGVRADLECSRHSDACQCRALWGSACPQRCGWPHRTTVYVVLSRWGGTARRWHVPSSLGDQGGQVIELPAQKRGTRYVQASCPRSGGGWLARTSGRPESSRT
jgi:hypothetical protein